MLVTKNFLKLLKAKSFNGIYRNCSQHPLRRTLRVITNEMPFLFKNEKQSFYPEHADIVVVGSGLIGSSVAYWLKMKCGAGLSVVVLEKDFTFKNHLEKHCFNGLSQHHSVMENMFLSQFSAEFLRTIKTHLGPECDVSYQPHGHLVLANEVYAELLEQNVTFQKENGIKNELLTPDKIKKLYPWINIEDIKLGCIASESEGWFDPWLLQRGLMLKSHQLGALYVNAEVTQFDTILQRDMMMEGIEPGSYRKADKLVYKTQDGQEHKIKFSLCILTGSNAKEIAGLLNIGSGTGLNAIELPLEQRKMRVFCIESCNGNRINLRTPLIKDINGIWMRRNGFDNTLICGHSPPIYDPSKNELSDEEYFQSIIQPAITHRLPELGEIKLNSAKSETYDFNRYDESGIIGPHPYYYNLLLATGFGLQGIEHAPGIGRAISELIIDNQFATIDLLRFGFDRFIVDKPVIEVNSY